MKLPDKDEVFAYDTVRLVRVLDRRLGGIYYTVFFSIVLYVVIYVFIIKKQYLQQEKTTGWAICKVSQPQISHLGIAWDVYDRVTNPGEQGAVFIPTRILITKGQTQGDYCESPMHNCTQNTDCDIGNELLQKKLCTPTGRCMRRQWCPAEDPKAATTETHYLDIEQVELWFSTYVHYHRFNLDVSTTDEQEQIHYPRQRANTYRLRDLVRMAGVEPEEFAENGAVMLFNSQFSCQLDPPHTCDMLVETHNVDTATGYNHVYNHKYWEDGVEKHDRYRMYGVRMMTFTTGFGAKTSLPQIMLQISSAISLLGVAEVVTDFYMSNVVPERKHYLDHKIIQTEDFNED